MNKNLDTNVSFKKHFYFYKDHGSIMFAILKFYVSCNSQTSARSINVDEKNIYLTFSLQKVYYLWYY